MQILIFSMLSMCLSLCPLPLPMHHGRRLSNANWLLILICQSDINSLLFGTYTLVFRGRGICLLMVIRCTSLFRCRSNYWRWSIYSCWNCCQRTNRTSSYYIILYCWNCSRSLSFLLCRTCMSMPICWECLSLYIHLHRGGVNQNSQLRSHRNIALNSHYDIDLMDHGTLPI